MVAGLRNVERRLGSYAGAEPSRGGTLLVVIGGLHGNEPAGVLAFREVLAELEALGPRMRGRVVGFAGNVGALGRGTRYQDRDLNRMWTDAEIEELEAAASLRPEGREQLELLHEIQPLLTKAWEEIVLLDLHSTSAEGSPFTIMGDTLQNRRVAFALPIPVILGLEERVEGTLVSFFSERGHTAVCVEGGQNESPETVANHRAAIWLTLVSTGLVDERDAPDLASHRRTLERAARDAPAVVELRHRQDVPDDTVFEMRPGYVNFMRVSRGETLGHLRDRATPGPPIPTRPPLDGMVLMPRYQGQGNDAYFVGGEVRPFWLRVSAWLRRRRLEWALSHLPGIHRPEAMPRTLEVDASVARWYVLEILHLFGYRRTLREGPRLVFIRRRDRI